MDGGDAKFYRDDDCTVGHVSANEQSTLWAKAGLRYPYNEFRACYAMANAPLVQRLADKTTAGAGTASAPSFRIR